MWFMMEKIQSSYNLTEDLLNEINEITPTSQNVKIEAIKKILHHPNTQVNLMHGNMMALHCACINGSSEVVSMLLQAGADVNIRDGYERTPLHYAAEKCDKCVGLLIDAGADTNAPDSNNNTPLHWACYRSGADVNALDRSLDSPLSWAALKGHLDIIRLLLNYNADPHTVNLSGSSPIGRIVQTICIGIGSAQEEACLRLLVKACGPLNIMQGGELLLADSINSDPQMSAILLPHLCKPRPLQQLSCLALRRAFGPGYLPDKVYSIGLPKSLQSFVLLL